MRLGFVGIGHMGSLMVPILLEAGYDVTAFDIDVEAMRRAVSAGASPARRLRDVAGERYDATFVCLRGPSEVGQVVLDHDEGLVNWIEPGAILIDMTTNSLECSAAIDAAATSRGFHYLDAPVTGEPPSMTVFVGGAREALDRVRSPLMSISSEIIHVGDNGAGVAVKLVRQMMQYASFLSYCDAIALANRLGIEYSTVRRVVPQDGAVRYTSDVLAARVYDDPAGAPLSLLAKDMTLVGDLARSLHFQSAGIDRLESLFTAGVARGWGSLHFATIFELIDQQIATTSAPPVSPFTHDQEDRDANDF